MLYELTIITREVADELDLEHLKRLIGRYTLKINKVENEGVKRLAYPIDNNEKGRYMYYELEMDRENQAKLSSRLNVEETVLRYLLVRADTGVRR